MNGVLCHVSCATITFEIGFFDEKRVSGRNTSSSLEFLKKETQNTEGQVP